MLIDHTNRRVVDVLESRDKAAVVAWLTAHKGGLLAGLEEVTCDMWDAYAEATREVFGDAVRVTIDRSLSGVEGPRHEELPGPAVRRPA